MLLVQNNFLHVTLYVRKLEIIVIWNVTPYNLVEASKVIEEPVIS
jgi:hypothetical protein